MDEKRIQDQTMKFDSLTGAKSRILVMNDNNKGVPAGGVADGRGLNISWQSKPVDREAGEVPTGAFVEDVLEVCKLRLMYYQESFYACKENKQAIAAIGDALEAMASRRTRRGSPPDPKSA